MSSAALREILGGPEYIGPVAGVKQEYHVFRTARGDYVVFSKSNRGSTSFHMTFDPSARVETLKQLIPKKGATSGSLLKEKGLVETFGIDDKAALYFEVLTTLYVMAALGIVEITKSGRNLVFTPRKLAEVPPRVSELEPIVRVLDE
ncbi:MAG TPA: hypothetical protein VGS04_07935 [Nitrososphaerales archaeon]|nr:hypothetical protein [Nitrososphaerales archaeon]